MGIIMSETTTTTGPSTDLLEIVEAKFTADQYSPYKMIGVVNSLLQDLKVDKTLPTQMGYQYVEKGYIKSVETTKVQKKSGETVKTRIVEKEAAVEWTAKYVAAQLTK
jgi:hypothetical protein